MSLYDYLHVCLCVFTTQKTDQAGGPETFLTLFGLLAKTMHGVHAVLALFKLCLVFANPVTCIYNYK